MQETPEKKLKNGKFLLQIIKGTDVLYYFWMIYQNIF